MCKTAGGRNNMEWFKDLYDDFRMMTGFGSVSEEQTKKEVDFLRDVLQLPQSAKILDLFCGAGRHSLEFARRGYVVTGVEYNPDYLKLANSLATERNVAPNFIQGDVRHVDYGAGYDAVIIMFHSFGYFSDEEDTLVLTKIYDALKASGRFLIEILNRDWIIKNFAEIQEREIEGIRILEKRAFDVLTSRNNFVIERHEGSKVVTRKGSWRLYSAHEIKNILENIGFKFVAAYGSLEKGELTIDTRLMRLAFEK
jgi:SAM-dependent methyltransferase